MRRNFVLLLVALVLLSGVYLLWHTQQANAPSNPGAKPTGQSDFNKKQYSTVDPASLWVVVNKQRPLNPKDYAPEVVTPGVPLRLDAADGEMHVSKQMAPSLTEMFQAADAQGAPMRLASAYRSYQLQTTVYDSEVTAYGQAKADSESARPGFSEHQTGLAVDIEPLDKTCEIDDCFAQTAQGKWLAANAYRYGFIHRYTPDKVAITGYRAEAWHFRYVGTALSTEMHDKHIQTLEEFFDLGAAPDYKR